MKRIVIAFVLFSIKHDALFAQEHGTFHSFSAGVSILSLTDPTVQPGGLTSNAFLTRYSIDKFSYKRKSSFSIGWKHASPTISGGSAYLNNFSISLKDGFSMTSKRVQRFSYFLGYTININTGFIEKKTKDEHYYSWSTSNSLGLYQSFSYRWKGSKLALDVSIPVVGFASRPGTVADYANSIQGLLYDSYSHLFTTSFHNHKAIETSIEYARNLNRQVSLFGKTEFQYSEMKTTLPVLERSFGIQAGIRFKL